MAEPKRGEVWLVDLGFAAKVRPCVILSIPATATDRALVTALAHTTSGRGTQFEVEVSARFLKAGVFDGQNLITVPHSKLQRRLGILDDKDLVAVELVVRKWLGL